MICTISRAFDTLKIFQSKHFKTDSDVLRVTKKFHFLSLQKPLWKKMIFDLHCYSLFKTGGFSPT